MQKGKIMGLFSKIKEGLKKTSQKFKELFKKSELDDDFYDELEYIFYL